MKKIVVFFNFTKVCKHLCLFVFLCLCGLIFVSCSHVQQVDSSVDMNPRLVNISDNSSTSEIVDSVKSAVVGISSNSNYGISVGSGVAISPGGYILTNEHVINGAKNIKVYFADKTEAGASLVWKDAGLDLAVIKSAKDLPYLKCNLSGETKVGEDIIAIGTPLTLDFRHSVTKGIVSALNRTVQLENENGTVSYMQNLIQHDASINPGNSGGPLINSNGEVIGINTLKAADAEGIGFAIPISVGKSALDILSVDVNWTSARLGLFGLDNNVASFINDKKHSTINGVYVVEQEKNSNSYIAGIKKGDIIIRINDNEINNVLDLRLALYKIKCGDIANITIIRENEKMDIKCKIC